MLFDSIEERFSTPFWAGSSICWFSNFTLKSATDFRPEKPGEVR